MSGENTRRRELPRNDLLTYEQRHNMLLQSIEHSAINPLNGDRDDVEAGMYEAVLMTYENREDFKTIVRNFSAVRSDLITVQSRYVLRSALQKQVLRQYADYPMNFNESVWCDAISRILDKPSLKSEFQEDLLTRHLQTNIKNRYKSLPVLTAWLRANGRMEADVNILDIGCSRNHGLKQLWLMEHVPNSFFSKTVVVEPVKTKAGSAETKTNIQRTEAFNRHQNTPVGLRLGLGIDKESINDPGNTEWARANLTPREFKEYEIEQYDLLDSMQIMNNISFYQYNLLDRVDSPFLETSPENHGGFDIVSLFTVLNQLTEPERYELLRIARRYANPTGLVVIQDFAMVNPDLEQDLFFLDQNWNDKYSNRTIILDMMNPTKYQEVLMFATGRCDKVQLALGKAAVGVLSGNPSSRVSLQDFLAG